MKTFLRLIGVGLFLGALLSGCGGSSSSSGDTNSTTDTNDTADINQTTDTQMVTCDTTLFQAGANVVTPTAVQLESYANEYDLDEGYYNDSYEFVQTGTAVMNFGADGTLTYDGTIYDVKSVCLETFNDGTQDIEQLVISTEVSNIDIQSSGYVTGSSPADTTITIQSQM